MRFVIVTGMSGAGKSTVLKMLEDVGFFCVDNLPVMLIEKFAEIAHDDKLEVDNVAIGVDIRSGQALGEMSVCLETLKKRNFTYEILFLDANEPVLVKRIYPEITGVSIVCEGGDRAEIQAKLIKAVSTALGISSNRICIVGKK